MLGGRVRINHEDLSANSIQYTQPPAPSPETPFRVNHWAKGEQVSDLFVCLAYLSIIKSCMYANLGVTRSQFGNPDPVPEMALFCFDQGSGGDTLHGGAPGTNPFSPGTNPKRYCHLLHSLLSAIGLFHRSQRVRENDSSARA